MGCGSEIAPPATILSNESTQNHTPIHGKSSTKPAEERFALHTKTRFPVATIDITKGPIDKTFSVQLDYSKCIGCHNCARACDEWQGFHVITKGPVKIPPYIQTYALNRELNDETHRIRLDTTDCVGCGNCVSACPTNAFQPRNQVQEVLEALQSNKVKVAVLAPATRVGLAEAFGMGVGATCERQLVKALRGVGFQYVFDNLYGADITTREDAAEVLKAKSEKKGPVFTSCCPAWVNLCERKYPQLLGRLSTAKSPHGSICTLIKRQFAASIGKKAKDLCVVGCMPCTAKKDEAARKELTTDGVPDCDISITSREIFDFLKSKNIEFTNEKEKELEHDEMAKIDAPYAQVSGSAYIYGKTAGVTESIVRYLGAKLNTEVAFGEIVPKTIFLDEKTKHSVKQYDVLLSGQVYKFVVATGGSALRKTAEMVMANELECDSIEMMACLHGCQGGGGQPKNMKKMEIPTRATGLNEADTKLRNSSSFDNKSLDAVYDKLGKQVHEYFHTQYSVWK
ncbi:FeFe-hydrogenase 6 [Spironucleus salmonicida]|uniref:FeFe-hydrogenase 6 n=1 Tax=Spironucleus salmonicida TaxID=348837 RepID=K7R8M7_9EUKA|nr:FeFe-hydrogenase 6 [Spironucleus salmonicida]KAH0575796.1 FeFe-hydrogenase 6 [Spironucleus salmonicida]|eukprot:EST49607.1 [FeFe]-hydrogenase 6 [Spironucleus salmonicida]